MGATTLPKALVGQTAAALANLLGGCVQWQALGVSGYDSRKVLNRLVPKLPDTESDFIILSVGVNDVTGLTTIRQWRHNVTALLDKVQTHSPDAIVAVSGLPPLHSFPLLPQPLRAVFGMRSQSLDIELRNILNGRSNCLHVPLDFEPDPGQFAADGYHPSEESYAEYGVQVAEALNEFSKHRVLSGQPE